MLEAYSAAVAYLVGNPFSFVLLIFGVVWGIVFGSVPGLTGIVGVALLIPFTFVLDPTAGLLLLSGVYVGSTFGGSISAILFNTPGSPEAACTALDGYPMARKGQAGKALGIALASSAIGGIFGTIMLMLLAPPMARFALNFGRIFRAGCAGHYCDCSYRRWFYLEGANRWASGPGDRHGRP